MRILQISTPENLKQMMQEIRVDPYGIDIMLPKGIDYLIRMNSVSNIAANILKQEMLSLGGDVAVARQALTGKIKKTDCLLIGSLSQLIRLNEKLKKQPFGLNRLGEEIAQTIKNYQKDNFTLSLGRYKINLGRRTQVMGILNLTPDSFSGDGIFSDEERAVAYAEQLVSDGADIIDVGGESSRPDARPVALKEELSRVIPVIKMLARKIRVPLSIDTYKPQVARQTLDCGALMVNDISGLKNPEMAKVTAKYKAGVVIMHMRGNPRTMQKNLHYDSLMDEVIEYLSSAIKRAQDAGIDQEKIIIDPGIGFGKTLEHNLEILKHLGELKILGRPILVGPSRKSFIGKILNAGPKERIFGSVSACVMAAQNGAQMVRVHDVKEVAQALKISDAVER